MRARYSVYNPGKLDDSGHVKLIVAAGEEVNFNQISEMVEWGLQDTAADILRQQSPRSPEWHAAKSLFKSMVTGLWNEYIREPSPSKRMLKAERYCSVKEAYLHVYGESGDTEV